MTLTCENDNCKQNAPELVQSGNQFVCPPCVPDEVWERYPRAKERELKAFATYQQRAATAKARFHSQPSDDKQESLI